MKKMSERNKTIFATEELVAKHKNNINSRMEVNKIGHGDVIELLSQVKEKTIDLVITDPPYNLEKKYADNKFKKMSEKEYSEWFENWVILLKTKMKENASIYVCSDWETTGLIYPILKKHFTIRNRITWSRDKGRSSSNNFKNNIEDIFYCTVSKSDFVFNADAILQRKEVIAPYRDENGNPKDWFEDKNGKYRLTGAANVWTDITVPYWSMHENTEHPTQKPEKLIAKLMLASSNKGDLVFDPFMGSGTTAVVAKKLGRKFMGIEKEEKYLAISSERLERCKLNDDIQGYTGKYFLARNEK